MKASTFIPSQCLTRGSRHFGTRRQPEPRWARTPTRKYRAGRSLEGGIGQFTLTLPLTGKRLGSSPPEQGLNLIHHLEKSLLETPSLLKTVARRRLASSSGAVSNRRLQSRQREFGCCQMEGQERSPRSGGVIHHQHWNNFPCGNGGRWKHLPGGAGSVTGSHTGVPQRRDVFGYNTCVCIFGCLHTQA